MMYEEEKNIKTFVFKVKEDDLDEAVEVLQKSTSTWVSTIENVIKVSYGWVVVVKAYGGYPFMENELIEDGLRFWKKK